MHVSNSNDKKYSDSSAGSQEAKQDVTNFAEDWKKIKELAALRREEKTDEDRLKSEKEWREIIEKTLAHDLEEALRSGAIAFLNAEWLVEFVMGDEKSKEEDETIIRPRQVLPVEAFLSFEQIVHSVECGWFGLFAVSYMWLDKDHPDPYGEVLQILAKALLPEIKLHTYVGLFWDFCSLHQHPDVGNGRRRNTEEETLFRQGLRSLGTLYSHPEITIFRVKEFPPRFYQGHLKAKVDEIPTYDNRGWPFTESCWATMTKPPWGTIDIHYGGDDESGPRCSDRVRRFAPCVPESFAKRLGTCSFTNEQDDRPLVVQLYTDYFTLHFAVVTDLTYLQLDLGDDQVSLLADIFSQGYAKKMKALRLRDNRLTAGGCRALAKALVDEEASPCFRDLDIAENPQISDDGLRELVPLFPRLTMLFLSQCGIGDVGCKILADNASSFDRLSGLTLEDNEDISDDGCKALVGLVARPKRRMAILKLAGCPDVCIDSFKELQRAALGSGDWDVYHDFPLDPS